MNSHKVTDWGEKYVKCGRESQELNTHGKESLGTTATNPSRE